MNWKGKTQLYSSNPGFKGRALEFYPMFIFLKTACFKSA